MRCELQALMRLVIEGVVVANMLDSDEHNGLDMLVFVKNTVVTVKVSRKLLNPVSVTYV